MIHVAFKIFVPDSEDEEEGQRKKPLKPKIFGRQKDTSAHSMCSKPYAAPCVALLYWFVLGCSLTRHEGRKTMWQKQCGSKLSRA